MESHSPRPPPPSNDTIAPSCSTLDQEKLLDIPSNQILESMDREKTDWVIVEVRSNNLYSFLNKESRTFMCGHSVMLPLQKYSKWPKWLWSKCIHGENSFCSSFSLASLCIRWSLWLDISPPPSWQCPFHLNQRWSHCTFSVSFLNKR